MFISSINNEHIKELNKLKDKKYRDSSNTFLVETKHLVLEAYKAGLLEELILEKDEPFSLNIKTIYVTTDILKKLSSTSTLPKIMGVVKKKTINNNIGNKVLILDNIQDPGNLGTIVRSAVAFNIDTIVLSDDSVDLYNPKVVRATQGMIFHINIIRKSLINFIKEIKNNYKIIGTKVTNGYNIKDIKITSPFALIIGNEGKGISAAIDKMCDEYLYIEMNNLCESLNAGVAASILMYEINNKWEEKNDR